MRTNNILLKLFGGDGETDSIQPTEKKSSNTLYIVLGIVLLCCISLCIGSLIFRKKRKIPTPPFAKEQKKKNYFR